MGRHNHNSRFLARTASRLEPEGSSDAKIAAFTLLPRNFRERRGVTSSAAAIFDSQAPNALQSSGHSMKRSTGGANHGSGSAGQVDALGFVGSAVRHSSSVRFRETRSKIRAGMA